MFIYGMLSSKLEDQLQNLQINSQNKILFGETLTKIKILIEKTLDSQNSINQISIEQMKTISNNVDKTKKMQPFAMKMGEYFNSLGIKINEELMTELIKITSQELKPQMNAKYSSFENLILSNQEYTSPQYRTNLFIIIITKLLFVLCISEKYQKNINKENQNNIVNSLMNKTNPNNIVQITFLNNVSDAYGYDVNQLQQGSNEFKATNHLLENFSKPDFANKIQSLISIYVNSSQSFLNPANLLFNRHTLINAGHTVNIMNLLAPDLKELSLFIVSFIYAKYPPALINFLSYKLGEELKDNDLQGEEYNNFVRYTVDEMFLQNELKSIEANPSMFQKYIANAKFSKDDFGQGIYEIDKILKNKDKYINMPELEMKQQIKNLQVSVCNEYSIVMKYAGRDNSKINSQE